MTRLLSIARGTSKGLAWLGGALIILSALLVTLEVLLRKLFNVSIGGADELSGYAFGIATTLGFSYALLERAHIRIDVLHALFPRRLRVAADLFGAVLLAGFVGIVCVMAWDLVADTLQHGSRSITPLRTPLALPQIPWLLGWLLFLVCSVLVILAAIKALIVGDHQTVNSLIGTRSIDEQIEDEVV